MLLECKLVLPLGKSKAECRSPEEGRDVTYQTLLVIENFLEEVIFFLSDKGSIW